MTARRTLMTACITSVLAGVAPSMAQGIRILDCNGQTRAVHRIPQALDYVVEVSIVDKAGLPKKSSEITLTSREGKLSAKTDDEGTAQLTGVKPGVYLVGSPEHGLSTPRLPFQIPFAVDFGMRLVVLRSTCSKLPQLRE